jgi:hypothetical protein
MFNKWDIARRDVLKSLGLGAACLPILNASAVWAQNNPGGASPFGDNYKRFVIIHATAGYWQATWKPKDGPLQGQTLPMGSSPLEPVKDKVIFLHSMNNPAYTVGYNWGHECYGTIYWGGPQKAPGGKYQEPTGTGAKSLDQIIAEGLPKGGAGFRLSLNFQDGVDRQPRAGTTGSIRCHWRGPGQPINPEMNPSKTYQALFAGLPSMPAPDPMGGNMGGGPDPAVTKLMAQKKSILDYVGKSLEKFKTRVSKDDKSIVEGHLTSIRELEGQISGMATGGGTPGLPIGPVNATKPEAWTDEQIMADGALFPKIMDSYMDMMFVALRAGVTRVATLQLANGSGNQLNFGAFVPGIPARGTGYKSAFRNWHDLGHNPSMGGVNHKIIVDKWCMEKYAGWITKLNGVMEPNGKTMLDNTVTLWGNHMESGDNHGAYKIPWMLAGSAGGALKTGQCKGGQTISAAMADICKAMGVTQGIPSHFTGTMGIL